MIMKRFSLVSFCMLVLLWLLPAGVASAAEAVASPHDMLAPGYTMLLDNILFEDVVEVDILPEDFIADEAALASAPDPDPMSFLQVVDIITSKKILDDEKSYERKEQVGTLGRLSKSMWYNDGDLAYQDITVWDNQGKVKHYRDEIEIIVKQIGQGGHYTKIDGVHTPITAMGNVTSSYPDDFINYSTYTITKKDIDPDAPYTIFTVGHIMITHPGQTIPYTRFETNVYIYWDDEGLTEAPEVYFQYDSAMEKMVMVGANSQMEYRLKTQSSADWQPCTDEPMYFDCVSNQAVAYYVRYIDGGNGKASKVQEVILPVKQAKPDVTYNKATENISGLTSEMEIQIGDGDYLGVTESEINLSDLINDIPNDSTLIVKVRYKATDTAQAGVDTIFTLRPRAEAPTTIKFDPITNILSGYTTAMAYKGESDTSWKSLSGTELNLEKYAKTSGDAIVLVRLKATTENSASLPVEIVIPKLLPAPNGVVDYYNEIIYGLDNINYQYSTSGSSWTNLAISNGQWDISSFIKTTDKTLYLRKAKTETTPVTAAKLFELPARPAAPETPVFVYNDPAHSGKAVLNGLTADMQYRAKTDTDWIDVGNNSYLVFDIPTTSVTYYVRYKATDNSFASSNKTVTLSKPKGTPGCSYDKSAEMITSLATTMEMKIGDGAYKPVTSTSFSTSSLIDGLAPGASLTIYIRYKETDTTPAGLEKTFVLYARGDKPTTLVYNYATNSLTGCSKTMEYKLEGAASWTSISGTTLNLQSNVKADRDVKVYVRTKATTSAAASQAVEFIIPMLAAGPTGTIDYANESIIGLANGAYQYSTNNSSWTNVSVVDGHLDISSIVNSANRKLYLRKAATSSEPLTAATIFELSARPVAPQTPAFVYNNTSYPGQAVLTGLTSDMQYKRKTATEWTNVGSDTNIVFDVPTSSVVYYVRTMPTDQSFASLNKSVTLTKPGTAPGCVYSGSTELITSLTTSMELKIDNGSYEPVTATQFSTTDLIDALQSGNNIKIYVRYKATSAAPASLDKVFTLYARGASPTTLVYNYDNNSLSGCSNKMEYRLASATKWTSISGTTLSLKKYAKEDQDVVVYVRMKSTSSAAASWPVEFVIPSLSTQANYQEDVVTIEMPIIEQEQADLAQEPEDIVDDTVKIEKDDVVEDTSNMAEVEDQDNEDGVEAANESADFESDQNNESSSNVDMMNESDSAVSEISDTDYNDDDLPDTNEF